MAMKRDKPVFSAPRNQVEFIEKCPNCGSTKLYFDDKHSELICRSCGYVISDEIPIIEAIHGSRAVKVLVNPKRKKMAVILNGILKTNIEKAMAPFYAEIKRFNLGKQTEAEVLRICRRSVEKQITKRASKLEILSAAIYIVSKRRGIPIFFDDLEETFGVDRVKVLRAYRKICRELKIPMKPKNIADAYITRISSDMGFNGTLATVAMEVAKAKTTDNPLMLAAASIYVAAALLKLPITQKDVVRYARISEPALR
ncbi:transcription initiation factor IIB family protein, partial [Candidatus Bathyarchaeota archaeon]|nr:transcription initiation factor IIB family protein [Candidatus Bathyarchaeota archaeon]